MQIPVEIWLRGDNHASRDTITPVQSEARAWTDGDVAAVLVAMLRSLERASNPAATDRPITLRGFSWIVSPFEEGGVLIALELSLGAVVAGPFDIGERELSAMIERAIARHSAPTGHGRETVH